MIDLRTVPAIPSPDMIEAGMAMTGLSRQQVRDVWRAMVDTTKATSPELSHRALRVAHYIHQRLEQDGNTPTLKEIVRDAMGPNDKRGEASRVITGLARTGYLVRERDPNPKPLTTPYRLRMLRHPMTGEPLT